MNRRHLKHIVLNVLGMMLPMVVGFLVVPGLIERIGQERFGMLAITWMLVGYFGLLDLGLGRALTQHLAQQDAAQVPRAAQAAVARSARRLMLGMGLLWCVLLIATIPWAAQLLHTSPALVAEVPLAWTALAVTVPFLMWSTCSTGVLEARSNFVQINTIRVPSGVASFLLPWLVSHYTPSLVAMLGSVLLVRALTASTLGWVTRREFHAQSHDASQSSLRPLLRFGMWLTISNAVGPVLAYFDRLAIAALISIAAVTHYTVAFDVLARLPALPVAVFSVFFPLLSASHRAPTLPENSVATLLQSANRLLIACWVPGMALVALAGPWVLLHWVGRELVLTSTDVWRWLAVGVVINGFAHIPFTLLQSAGRTDTIAKIHLSELPWYILALWWALIHDGIRGAAIVWTLRVALDTVLLIACAMYYFPHNRRVLKMIGGWALGAGVVTLGIALAGPRAPSLSLLLTMTTFAAVWCGYHLRPLMTMR